MTNEPADLAARLAALERSARRVEARGAVENVFSRYMNLHNYFRDEEIVDLWVRPGTPGIRAQYTSRGAYTTYESVMAYHRGRPAPPGKLILHYTTTPLIEVAEDAGSACGTWIMAGLESGLMSEEQASVVPARILAPEPVQGQRVWAHWVWCRYTVAFLHQEDRWRIWRFRCSEIARAPFDENWISYADKDRDDLTDDLAYFGDDGRPVYMPRPDEPGSAHSRRYKPEEAMELFPPLPEPYRTTDELLEAEDAPEAADAAGDERAVG